MDYTTNAIIQNNDFVADCRNQRIVTECHNDGRVIENLLVFGSQMPDMDSIIRLLKNTTKDRYEKILLDLEKIK